MIDRSVVPPSDQWVVPDPPAPDATNIPPAPPGPPATSGPALPDTSPLPPYAKDPGEYVGRFAAEKPAPEVATHPRPPRSVPEAGIPEGLVEDIFMRWLLGAKRASTSEVGAALALGPSIVQQVADDLRDKGYLEYLGLEGREYRFTLTESGHAATLERMKISLYASYAPVSVTEYEKVVEQQRAVYDVDQARVAEIFSDLILPTSLIDKIGFALLNDGAMFLYGPPGTGKTSIAERMRGVLDKPILVPHCIEADGQIVMVFDPVVHRPVEPQPASLDPRWVLCERPLVIVGGELSMEMLDLSYEAVAGVYTAPIQLLANNGILVIDDFGRQTITPDEILNRWIVPLSRNVDYLKLTNGAKFTVPFAVKLVVSSNFEPSRLGDDAFLRRLRNKVFVGSCSPEAFDGILTNAAASMGVELRPDTAAHLREVAMKHIGELRPYVAVDFCDLERGIARYRGTEPVLDPDAVDEVAGIYFGDPEALASSW